MAARFKAVLCDLDGTLVDSVPDLHAAAAAMLADLSRPPIAQEAIRAYVGRGILKLVKRILAGRTEAADDPAPPPEAALASFRRHYSALNGHRSRLFPGVVEGLDALRGAGVPLAVITNKARDFTLPLLDTLGLTPYFSVVVSGDDLPRGKPDPMPLIWACGRLGVSPAEALMVGDSVHDQEAARAAGCAIYLVPYGYNEGRDVRELISDAIVPSLAAAAERLLD